MNYLSTPHLATSIIEQVQLHVAAKPTDTVYRFLTDGVESNFSYQELDNRARTIAAHLQQMNIRGERALLLYPSGLEYISAFLGCLYAGVIAVPAYPPRKNRSFQRIELVMNDCKAKVALTTQQIKNDVARKFTEETSVKDLHWIATDTEAIDAPTDYKNYMPWGDDIAFLQYTSGSTGSPKGVMVTHRNLIHNSSLINRFFESGSHSQGVIWLPPYHDMGLIGGILQPLYTGFPVTLMAPETFLQKPIEWLSAITQYKGTISGGPNFAYDLCVNKITEEQKATLDLSSWEVAFNGAEPIRAHTIKTFSKAFESCGFRQEAFYTCYGMAEATLFVTGCAKSSAPRVISANKTALENNHVILNHTPEHSQELVGSGLINDHANTLIVHPDSLTKLPDNQIGEIWISGESIAKGYWNKGLQNTETFYAYLFDSGEGPFMRTGDLGFIHKGELYVTGRLKDLIIVRGKNHYPQDIEATAEQSHPSLQHGACIAFTVDVENAEQLVLVQEVKRTALHDFQIAEVSEMIRREVAEHHGLPIHEIVFLKTGGVPKTSSGKLQRQACKKAYLEGSMDVIAHWQTTDAESTLMDKAAMEKLIAQYKHLFQEYSSIHTSKQLQIMTDYLADLIAYFAEIPRTSLHLNDPVNKLGLDSLKLVELKSHVQDDTTIEIDVLKFLDGVSIRELALDVCLQLENKHTQQVVSLTHKSESQESVRIGNLTIPAQITADQAQHLLDNLDTYTAEEQEHILNVIVSENPNLLIGL